MNILIKGFGSIGKRHFEVLRQIYPQAKIDLISSQNIPNAFPSFQEIRVLNNYDYFVLATPTSKHYEELVFLDKEIDGKIIFVEKPLFSRIENFIPSTKNQIYIGYVLRFHPLIQHAKKLVEENGAYFVEVSCGSYLPNWRPNIDYRKVYSARLELGGGVLLDLSHEIDYLRWIFGDFKTIKGINTKISELKIDTDDLATFIITTECNTIINLTLNYFSKIPKRTITIHTKKFSTEIDLVANTINQIDTNNVSTTKSFIVEHNDLFRDMHINTLESNVKILPDIFNGEKTMKTISRMQNENK